MTKILLKIMPDSGRNDFAYFLGKLHVFLTLDKSFTLSENYSISFHTDAFHTLSYGEGSCKQMPSGDYVFRAEFNNSHVWLPDDYFLLFRSGDTILRFDFRYDEPGTFTETGSRQCFRLSEEDILSGTLVAKRHWRVYFSNTPGGVQLKRWVIGRLQERAFNALRSEYHQFSLDYCNSLLVSTDSEAFLGRSMLLMRQLAEVNVPTTLVDCNTLFHDASSDPCYKIDEIFQEDDREFMPDVSLPSLREHLYHFTNMGALLEPGREKAIDRILHYCPTALTSVVFCGTQQEIDRLLELAPTLQEKVPMCNRLQLTPYSPNEMIRLFFHELDQARLTLAPEAVDAACRLFYERHRQGEIAVWTLFELRRYVSCHILPAYRRRAISAIAQGVSPAEVLDVRPEDL